MALVPNSFSNLEDIMNLARAKCNESYNGGAGEILTDTAPFTAPYINSALQDLQDRLENNAYVTLTVDNFQLLNIPAIVVDPSAQIFIDPSGCYLQNSVGITLLDATIVLPQDMMIPEMLSERQTGTNFPYVEMTENKRGLSSANQGPRFYVWELRRSANPNIGNAIWFRGATEARDIRIRYKMREASIVAGTDFTTINIDLPGAGNALAHMIAYSYTASRNPETAPLLDAKAAYYIREIIKRTVKQKQSIDYSRPAYGGDRGNGGHGRNNIL